MIVCFLRSSSVSDWKMCRWLYFMNYVLGIKLPSSKAADKGNVIHKVAECLALEKLAIQNGKKTWKDDSLYDKRIKVGGKTVKQLTDDAFDYYDSLSPNTYTDADRRECHKWVDRMLSFRNGMMDVRNMNILDAEKRFTVEIPYDWAKFEYTHNGETISGQLNLKGTVDLVVLESKEILHIIDLKTGARKDWGTGKTKEYEHLEKDFQLRMYYYALRKTYPEYKNILVTIYYINPFKDYNTKKMVEGGPFTLSFSDNDMIEIEEEIKEYFTQIKEDTEAKDIYPDAPCNFFCAYNKTLYGDTNKSVCHYLREEFRNNGMQHMLDNHVEGELFQITNQYASGGGRQNVKD